MTLLGDMIRDVRRERGLTMSDVAKGAGFSVAYVSDIEHGNRHPTTDAFLSAIAAPLGIDPDIVYYCAGRIPPDLRGLDVTPDQVRNAFSAFRAVLNGDRGDT